MMGIWMRGLRFTSPMSVQSAVPVYICARVRPWMVSASMPQSCNIPSEAGFHRDGNADGINHGACDVKHERHVLQHAGSGSFSCHALYGTAEIEVKDVGVGGFFHNLCRIAHGFREAAVYLDGNGTLVGTDAKLLEGLRHRSHEGIGCHKLAVDHGGSHPPAQQAESYVRHVLHRGEEERARPEVDVSYFQGWFLGLWFFSFGGFVRVMTTAPP